MSLKSLSSEVWGTAPFAGELFGAMDASAGRRAAPSDGRGAGWATTGLISLAHLRATGRLLSLCCTAAVARQTHSHRDDLSVVTAPTSAAGSF